MKSNMPEDMRDILTELLREERQKTNEAISAYENLENKVITPEGQAVSSQLPGSEAKKDMRLKILAELLDDVKKMRAEAAYACEAFLKSKTGAVVSSLTTSPPSVSFGSLGAKDI